MSKPTLVLILAVATTLSTSPAVAQEWFEDAYGVGKYARMASEDVAATVRHYRVLIDNASKKTSGSDLQWYVELLTRARQNAMQVLQNRDALPDEELRWRGPGDQTPQGRGGSSTGSASGGTDTGKRADTLKVPRSLGAGGDKPNTLAVPRPGAESPKPNASIAIPLTVVLTAARAAECKLRGRSDSQCITELLQSAASAAIGSVVVAILPGGQVIATGVVLAETVLTVANAGGEAIGAIEANLEAGQSQANLEEQQRRNARAFTPGRIAALKTAFAARRQAISAAFTNVDVTGGVLKDALSDLTDNVEKARTAFDEFRTANAEARKAADTCRDPEKNPVRFVVDVEERVTAMKSRADQIATDLQTARNSACDQEGAGKRAYDAATKSLEELRKAFNETGEDIRDATTFFFTLQTGRSAVDEAARRISVIETELERARVAAKELTRSVTTYTAQRDTLVARSSDYLAGVAALKGALPSPPPPDVAGALAEIEAAFSAADLDVFNTLLRDNDVLRQNARDADTEANRIEGLLREARRQFDTMEACEGITETMPESLRTLLQRLSAEAMSHARRGEEAVAKASDIPGLLAGCTPAGKGSIVDPEADKQPICPRLPADVRQIFDTKSTARDAQKANELLECHLQQSNMFEADGSYAGMRLSLFKEASSEAAKTRMRRLRSQNYSIGLPGSLIGDEGYHYRSYNLNVMLYARGRYVVWIYTRTILRDNLQEQVVEVARRLDEIVSRW